MLKDSFLTAAFSASDDPHGSTGLAGSSAYSCGLISVCSQAVLSRYFTLHERQPPSLAFVC